jgi:hypothetical protein
MVSASCLHVRELIVREFFSCVSTSLGPLGASLISGFTLGLVQVLKAASASLSLISST